MQVFHLTDTSLFKRTQIQHNDHRSLILVFRVHESKPGFRKKNFWTVAEPRCLISSLWLQSNCLQKGVLQQRLFKCSFPYSIIIILSACLLHWLCRWTIQQLPNNEAITSWSPPRGWLSFPLHFCKWNIDQRQTNIILSSWGWYQCVDCSCKFYLNLLSVAIEIFCIILIYSKSYSWVWSLHSPHASTLDHFSHHLVKLCSELHVSNFFSIEFWASSLHLCWAACYTHIDLTSSSSHAGY